MTNDKDILYEIFHRAGLNPSNVGCDLVIEDTRITFNGSNNVNGIESYADWLNEDVA